MRSEGERLSLERLLSRKVLAIVGPGGVGKTTSAAALGILAARHGKRVLVLTVDPAKRLADALGVGEMMSEPTPIDLPEEFPGQLSAMMLDPKRTFDGVVQEYATDSEAKTRILDNPFYKHASQSLAGCQEYMAMEELFAISEGGEYDLIVLDTPPSKHALDFLDAPGRLRGFFESRTFGLFLDSTHVLGRVTRGLFSRFSPVMSGMSLFVGEQAFKDLLVFLRTFQGMTEGFSERAAHVDALMASSDVGFVLVCGLGSTSLHEARHLLKRISEDQLHLDGVLVNRIRVSELGTAGREWLETRFEQDSFPRWGQALLDRETLAELQQNILSEFREQLSGVDLVAQEERTEGLGGLSDLVAFGQALVKTG